MNLEVITIGTELVLGFTVDTNAAFIGQELAGAGVSVARRTTVGDDPSTIREAVRDALGRTRLVLTTGGLGPTRDDLSKKVVADLFGAPLEFQQPLWDGLVERFARMGRVPAESNRCQAEVPRGAVVLPNRRGTAPGLWLSGALGEVIMLPGVPSEMRGLIREEVVPRLASRSGGTTIRSLTVRTTGIPESTLGERVSAVESTLAPLTLAYLPSLDGVDLRLTGWNLEPEEADRLLGAAAGRILEVVRDHGYGTGEQDLAAVTLDALRTRGLTLAVAESCTGGLVGERVTRIPGSSDAFLGGVIAYANGLKEELLHVNPETLASSGAVSEACVREMAAGVCRATGAEVGIAVTGVAGPSGGTVEKPVGTVWFGFQVKESLDAVRIVFPGSRREIQARAAQFALHGVLRRVRQIGHRP